MMDSVWLWFEFYSMSPMLNNLLWFAGIFVIILVLIVIGVLILKFIVYLKKKKRKRN